MPLFRGDNRKSWPIFKRQLEVMKWLWDLQSTCRDAVLCCAWINNECWPYTSLRGFGFDLSYSVLFCFRVSAWINDDAMQAFNKKTKALVPVNTQQEIGSSVASFPFILIPVTLGGVHWGCLVLDSCEKLIKIYDSMGGKGNRKSLRKIAGENCRPSV
ncbi:hypothetical protein JG688_00005424 [Phytophthora aleatoria]|uniref:Ubiquitin-like protease family profile domain-containing protein n=1 Tax=Phytophthora aleatoria TaxID=2496075 RepID=A0A8J5MGZ7_9STRA|nr:hypothetical protein JG688_00005424 [Phytophthora aleatoria]